MICRHAVISLKSLLHFLWHRVSKPGTLRQLFHWSIDSSWKPSKFWGSWARPQGGMEARGPHSLELAFVCWRQSPHAEGSSFGTGSCYQRQWGGRIRINLLPLGSGVMSLKGKAWVTVALKVMPQLGGSCLMKQPQKALPGETERKAQNLPESQLAWEAESWRESYVDPEWLQFNLGGAAWTLRTDHCVIWVVGSFVTPALLSMW